ncbi:MAG: ABC transporter permease [Candidatus Omnitrophota bacterium]
MRRLKAVMRKEFAHILRDPTSLMIVFIMPLVMMFVFGYSVNYDLKHIETGVIDFSGGDYSRHLIKKFANNEYFKVIDLQTPNEDPLTRGERLIRAGKLKEFIIIPPDFTQRLREKMTTHVGIVIDGSDSNVANLVYQYNESVLMDFVTGLQGLDKLVNVKTKILFNPELKSSTFFVPGMVAILLMMISAILTSVSIAREKESGSIDLIFISPLKTPEIILGKTLPYISVALLVGALILAFARFWFGIPIRGSLLALLLFSLLYVISGLSLGILVSTVAPSQKAAMLAALLSTLLPSIMLSGFIFPLDSLAPVLQWISHIVPATYYLKIIRGVAVKGAKIGDFITEGIAMILFAVILLTLAGIKFSRNRKHSK